MNIKLKVVKQLKMFLFLTVYFLVIKIQPQKSYFEEIKEYIAVLKIITRKTKT